MACQVGGAARERWWQQLVGETSSAFQLPFQAWRDRPQLRQDGEGLLHHPALVQRRPPQEPPAPRRPRAGGSSRGCSSFARCQKQEEQTRWLIFRPCPVDCVTEKGHGRSGKSSRLLSKWSGFDPSNRMTIIYGIIHPGRNQARKLYARASPDSIIKISLAELSVKHDCVAEKSLGKSSCLLSEWPGFDIILLEWTWHDIRVVVWVLFKNKNISVAAHLWYLNGLSVKSFLSTQVAIFVFKSYWLMWEFS